MKSLFPESISIPEAAKLQEEFALEIITEDRLPQEIKKLGGVMLHSRGDAVTVSIAILSTENFKKFETLRKEIFVQTVRFPSLPAFEGFREGRVLVELLGKFDTPDVYFIDGAGINHPRKFGLVSHVGLGLEIPTIAVSRDLTSGRVENRGGRHFIVENYEIRGEVLRKEPYSIPLYVGPGHMVSVDTASKIVKECMLSVLPEPLKVAHEYLVENLKR